MQLKPTPDPERAASVAADEVAAACRRAVTERGRAVIALSGGETPWKMIRALCSISLPWERIHVAQVDERVVPRGDPRRNLARLEEILVQQGPLPPANLLAMPVKPIEVMTGKILPYIAVGLIQATIIVRPAPARSILRG